MCQMSNVLLETEDSIPQSPSFWNQVHRILWQHRQGERGCGERVKGARKVTARYTREFKK